MAYSLAEVDFNAQCSANKLIVSDVSECKCCLYWNKNLNKCKKNLAQLNWLSNCYKQKATPIITSILAIHGQLRNYITDVVQPPFDSLKKCTEFQLPTCLQQQTVSKYYLTMKLRIVYRQQMNLVDISEDNKGSLNVRKPLLKKGTARIQKSQITLARSMIILQMKTQRIQHEILQ